MFLCFSEALEVAQSQRHLRSAIEEGTLRSRGSNNFTMLDNPISFDDPPIKKKNFEGKLISFNSFEKLKDYGEIIILKKIK